MPLWIAFVHRWVSSFLSIHMRNTLNVSSLLFAAVTDIAGKPACSSSLTNWSPSIFSAVTTIETEFLENSKGSQNVSVFPDPVRDMLMMLCFWSCQRQRLTWNLHGVFPNTFRAFCRILLWEGRVPGRGDDMWNCWALIVTPFVDCTPTAHDHILTVSPACLWWDLSTQRTLPKVACSWVLCDHGA